MKKSLLLIALALAFALPAHASIQQVRVLGVGVSRSSQDAQALAVDYAKKRAVFLVAHKFAIENVEAKVEAIKPEEFARIVRGATVMHVKREENITYADVSVSVIDTELKRVLGVTDTAGAGAADTPVMRGVLVLPVYGTASRAYLWEKDNLLRDPLRLEILRQTHGRVLVPAGDFEDLRLVDYQNAATVTGAELSGMFERYGVSEIIIVIAIPGADKTMEPTNVTLRRLTAKDAHIEQMSVPPDGEKDDVAARLQQAASAIATAVTEIATSTSLDQQAAMQQGKQVKVHFAYANPRELATMQQAVRGATGVILLEIPGISLQDVDGTVYYTGETAALKAALSKQGVIVREKSSDLWNLSMR